MNDVDTYINALEEPRKSSLRLLLKDISQLTEPAHHAMLREAALANEAHLNDHY